MKQFVANRSGAVPTLDVVNETKVKVYTNEAAIDADLANLEVGQIVSDKFKLYRKTANGKDLITGLGYGMPLGAVVELADTTQLPDGYLLCDGSTFDETVYPALYAYLGSDTLPVYTSHNKQWDTTIDLLTSTAFPGLPQAKQGSLVNAFEVPYDGVIGVRTSTLASAKFTGFYIIRNGTTIQPWQLGTLGLTTGYTNVFAGEYRVQRGDKVYVNDNRVTDFWYSYNTKYLAIKATPVQTEPTSDVLALVKRMLTLSDIESIKTDVAAATSSAPYVMPYDGEVIISTHGGGGAISDYIVINGVQYIINIVSYEGTLYTIPVNKGDTLYIKNYPTSPYLERIDARWYKNR